MNRIDRLRSALNRQMAIIEVGPSHNPVAPKRDGWRTTVVDHTSRQGLVEKYAEHQVDLARIEEVDVIWSGGALSDSIATAAHGTYDALILSHVLEHLPDPIAFFKAAAKLLTPSGIVVLAVPDKRFCFDFFGSLSTTGDWLSAHAIKAETHSRRAAFNHVAYAVRNDGRISWPDHPSAGKLALTQTLDVAAHHFAVATDTGQGSYTDYHAWRFTPCSLQLLLLETFALTGLDFSVRSCSDAINHEFFVTLERGATPPTGERLEAARLALLCRIIPELAQQRISPAR